MFQLKKQQNDLFIAVQCIEMLKRKMCDDVQQRGDSMRD